MHRSSASALSHSTPTTDSRLHARLPALPAQPCPTGGLLSCYPPKATRAPRLARRAPRTGRGHGQAPSSHASRGVAAAGGSPVKADAEATHAAANARYLSIVADRRPSTRGSLFCIPIFYSTSCRRKRIAIAKSCSCWRRVRRGAQWRSGWRGAGMLLPSAWHHLGQERRARGRRHLFRGTLRRERSISSSSSGAALSSRNARSSRCCGQGQEGLMDGGAVWKALYLLLLLLQLNLRLATLLLEHCFCNSTAPSLPPSRPPFFMGCLSACKTRPHS